MKTENVNLSFSEDAIREIARVTAEVRSVVLVYSLLTYLNYVILLKVNRTVENIGARRLHTVIERIVEELSFEAAERPGQDVTVDASYVKERIQSLLVTSDLRKYIL